jgi:RND superfamily putative drug exporter
VIGKKLTSPNGQNGQAALIVLHLRNEFMAIDNMALMRKIHRTLAELAASPDFPPGLKLGVTGSAAIGSDMLFSAEQSINRTEMTTVALVIIILLLVYRAPGLVLIPLITIGASVVVAMGIVAILAQFSSQVEWLDFKIFKTTRIFVVVILFGAGTDYCLFLIARYKEELQHGLRPQAAISGALARVGNALAASALTTILGLGMMFFADFGKYSNSGPAIALCLVVALAACVSLAPAMLRFGGWIVFWPFGIEASRAGQEPSSPGVATPELRLQNTTTLRPTLLGGFWQRTSRIIIARPGLILVASLFLLAPLTRPVRVLVGNVFSPEGESRQFGVPVTYDLLSELRSDCPSVRGTHLLWRHFPADQTGPVTVLATDKNAAFDSKEGRRKIALLTKELSELEYVDSQGQRTQPIMSVRSLTEPMGDAPGSFSPLSAAGRRKLVSLHHPKTKAAFVSQEPSLQGKITKLDLIFQYNPFSKESVRLLYFIEQHLIEKANDQASDWFGTEFDFVGTTAGIRDLETVTSSDQHRIQVLVVLAVLGVLIVILRRPMICVYLILSVLVGYYVTIGTTELFFSWLHGDSFTGLDWKVPLFLFVILIAVGEDYNIYLATRVFEEQRRRGPVEGLRVAVVRTGGIITSCGVIMAGTFASMTTGTIRMMHELGFALALGVLLDTFIIRTILVPAFLAILARREERKSSNTPAQSPTPTDVQPAHEDAGCHRHAGGGPGHGRAASAAKRDRRV